DLLPHDQRATLVQKFLRRLGWKRRTFVISALNGEGCRELTYAVMEHLELQRAARDEAASGERAVTADERTT
ncbi:MAG TPA: GTPase ObgE, partial [Burkholderiales bacterium]|nr:GTPase ObgE [Burkholderiales bacterium]